jgi:OOP family OmpA-OmpF porin
VLVAAAGARAPVQDRIPLVEGLTIVTAIAETRGDYESIKTVAGVSTDEIRVAYAAEMATGRKVAATRRVLVADMRDAREYRQEFSNGENRVLPGTTALGPSAAVLRDLKLRGEALFTTHTRSGGGLRKVTATITRVGTVTLPVLVNNARTQLAAVHAKGDYERETGEFWFLDDEANPLTLRYRFVEKKSEMVARLEEAAKGKLTIPLREYALDVVKIAFPGASGLEQQLAGAGRAAVYGIYFDFDKATLKPESGPVLAEIAALLAKNPAWTLSVEGHTDNIGTDARNLALSEARAGAVKRALVEAHGVSAARLTTAGFGASKPVEPNATLAGRARNRRVELARR